MLQRALTASGGGGDATKKEGEFQSLSNANVEVHDIGFKPDYLEIMSEDTTKSYTVGYTYTSILPNNKLQIIYRNGNLDAVSSQAMSAADTIRGTIVSVDDTGFTWGASAGNNNYATAPKFSYKAWKWND